MTVLTTVTVEKGLVRYLRAGVKHEMGANVLDLQVQLDKKEIEPPIFEAILACFDDSRALFETVGFTEDPSAADLEIDITRWPRLVLRVLETQYAAERMRLDDALADRYPIPERDVPALGELVAEIRRVTGAPRKTRPRYTTFLERQLAKRKNRRQRGDG